LWHNSRRKPHDFQGFRVAHRRAGGVGTGRARARLPARKITLFESAPVLFATAAATDTGDTTMTIAIGDKVPNVDLYRMGEKGPEKISASDLFAGRKTVLFALPGAFTPTCSQAHLPGYVVKTDELLAKGVDQIVCLSVNDAFVMDAWGRQQNAGDNIMMIADGSGEFTKAVGLDVDLSNRGLGLRSQRYAMVIEDGVVTHLNVEAPGKFEVSDVDTMLELL
jgi:glutaredoxin/glutathione-dependent peroxiredoxin